MRAGFAHAWSMHGVIVNRNLDEKTSKNFLLSSDVKFSPGANESGGPGSTA
jgi:hypothetical protein